MAKIDERTAEHFMKGIPMSAANTQVIAVNKGDVKLYLHGNLIARRNEAQTVLGVFEITSAGWDTRTTKNRLNALPGVHIYQRNFQWYLNGEKWDGRWATIENIRET